MLGDFFAQPLDKQLLTVLALLLVVLFVFYVGRNSIPDSVWVEVQYSALKQRVVSYASSVTSFFWILMT